MKLAFPILLQYITANVTYLVRARCVKRTAIYGCVWTQCTLFDINVCMWTAWACRRCVCQSMCEFK